MAERKKNVTIRDVAKHANVSVGTVSRVLSKNETVKQPLLIRVNHSIEALGYKPNLAARALRANKDQVLGLVLPDITNPFFAQLAKEIELEASRHGLAVILASSFDDPKKEARRVHAILDRAPTGIIVIPAGDERFFKKPDDVPIITIDRPVKGESEGVFADQEAGASLAADHVFALGHRNIVYISGPEGTVVSELRQRGFKDRITELCQGDPSFRLEIRSGLFDYETGERVARDVLGNDSKDRPTAIVAASDQQAIGALREARDIGVTVPDDLSIVGFDDITLANIIVPRLTTIRQPIEAMAKMAVRRVCDIAQEDGGLDASCSLIVRTSTAPAPD
ncbi:transcriptional regulator, LacI family [Cohaesibacter sp. ES.047]|uniref:LacI family DNA-binding transcriptional regulator n=1 Tax=Cohaesibacter sp. ES.047 TaxID=1798205 RepID=UPI000BB978F7|nr:LacI family DNA-binding transcriptional regulator [Cohaesibacter sp. ES.047]SNY90704.1 transcriptional regulator, LacI family [Cohaesibacter sp. ES.047]